VIESEASIDPSEDDCGRIFSFILHLTAAPSQQGFVGAGWGKFKSRCSPMLSKADWASFFALDIEVAEDFVTQRDDSPPLQREPLVTGADGPSCVPT
jgi:hypothetical protein